MISKGWRRLSGQSPGRETQKQLVTSVSEDPGEIQSGPVKTGRFVKTPLGWFVRTREARDLGPFSSREQAEAALREYLVSRPPVARKRQFAPLQILGMQIHEPEACAKQHCALCAEIHYWVRAGHAAR